MISSEERQHQHHHQQHDGVAYSSSTIEYKKKPSTTAAVATGRKYDCFKRRRTRRKDCKNPATRIGLVLIFSYALLISFGPFVLLQSNPDKSTWCPYYADPRSSAQQDTITTTSAAGGNRILSSLNPDYDKTDPCRYVRVPYLLYLTLEDCDICQRIMISTVLGGIIGYERQVADRSAGIQMMGLVALGSCFYTICSIMAFKSATMKWDSSRVTADLAKGVGFLGAALIWKGSITTSDGQERNQVHGLTTAASVWLSAAVGTGAGGALYEASFYCTCIVLLILRYGPRLYNPYAADDDDDGDDGDDESEEEKEGEQKEGGVNVKFASTEKTDNLDSLDKKKISSTPTLVGMAGTNDRDNGTLGESLLRQVRSETSLRGSSLRRRRSSKKKMPAFVS